MKKWLIAFTASAVLIGCGGGGGVGNSTSGGSGGSGGGTGGDRGIPTVILGNTAQGQVLYLSGQGRRATASQVAVLDNIRVYNSVTDFAPTERAGSAVRIQLDGYTLNQYIFNVPLAAGGPPKIFTKFPFEVAKIDLDDNGVISTLYSGPSILFQPFFNLNFPLYPGRQTTVQVTLNDQILKFDSTNGVTFDRDQFERENYAPFNGKINAFLSDMISFDVSQMPSADRPVVSSNERASMVHFSGDSIGISGAFKNDAQGVPKATYDNLNPVVIDSGTLRLPQNVGGATAPGIYTVLEPDPRDPFGNAKVLALKGTYRPYTDFLGNLKDFAMVAFPTTRSTTTNQVVLFNRNANGTIIAMWQGVITYSKSTSGEIRLYSLDQLPDATATPKASGKVSFTKVGGVVKQGNFSINNAPTTFPFPKTGKFVVLR